MNYTVKSGDNLWNIVKNNYNLTDNKEIRTKVDELANSNNIENADLIYEGQEISLFDLNADEKSNKETEDNIGKEIDGDFYKEKVKEYEEFTNSTNPEGIFQFAPTGTSLEDTGKNTLDFATKYIEANSSNGNSISFDDFRNNNKELDDETAKAIYNLHDIDGKNGISAGEYASFLTFVDSLDKNVDGNMSLQNLDSTVTTSFAANDKYSSVEGNAAAKENLADIKTKINQVYTRLYSNNNQNNFSNWLNQTDEKVSKSNSKEEAHEAGKTEFTVPNGDDKQNYSKNLKSFSSGIHAQFDKNGDGQLSADELKDMKFGSIKSMDINGDGQVNNGELATYFHSADLDIENYVRTQYDIASSVDGKFSYNDLQSRSNFDENSTAGKLFRKEQEEFYNHFYKQDEQ